MLSCSYSNLAELVLVLIQLSDLGLVKILDQDCKSKTVFGQQYQKPILGKYSYFGLRGSLFLWFIIIDVLSTICLWNISSPVSAICSQYLRDDDGYDQFYNPSFHQHYHGLSGLSF